MTGRDRSPDGRPAVVWFRDDLRLADNPALLAACADGRPVTFLYVLEDADSVTRPLGAAARWWLHHSLASLARDLSRFGATLVLKRGNARRIVPAFARETGAGLVVWNRRYGAAAAVDAAIALTLKRSGIRSEAFAANLLFEPEEVRSRNGNGFKVFSAFWRAARVQPPPRAPLKAPGAITPAAGAAGDPLESLGLLPEAPDWTAEIRASWQPGEVNAAGRLAAFATDRLQDYASQRDYPAEDGASRLSPHLRFGEISPYQVWAATAAHSGESADTFRAELGWREFAYHVFDQFPGFATENIRPEFERFPWQEPYADEMWAWRRGRTGYPIVDAGMRQLWQTGWMHNRVRMIVASFLTKHLLAPWQIGEEWFWDTLVDADPANNPFNWQWVAGPGVDAQPYFRIFNPVLQGEKFDPKGDYVRRYVPELAKLSDKFIHKPWEASPIELAAAGITPDMDYPGPIVQHAAARERALKAFEQMRAAN